MVIEIFENTDQSQAQEEQYEQSDLIQDLQLVCKCIFGEVAQCPHPLQLAGEISKI